MHWKLFFTAICVFASAGPALGSDIPVEVLESQEYQDQLRAWALQLEAQAAARPVARSAGDLRLGTGFEPETPYSQWRRHQTTACTADISLSCTDSRAPELCREPNCRALLEQSVEIPNVPLGWIPLELVQKLVGPIPKSAGAQPVGAGQERGYWLNPLTLRSCCLKGRWGAGRDCQATAKESILLAYTVPDGTGLYVDCLPAPEDSDGDGVANAVDGCDDDAGPAPSGCPAAEETDQVDKALELMDAARAQVAALRKPGPNSTGKLQNRLVPKRSESGKPLKPRPPSKIAEELRLLAAELDGQGEPGDDDPPTEELPAGVWEHRFPGAFEAAGEPCPSRVGPSDDDARLCPRQVAAWSVTPPAGQYQAAQLRLEYRAPLACPSMETASAKCEVFLWGSVRNLLGYVIGQRARFGFVKGFANKSAVSTERIPAGEWLRLTIDAFAGPGGGRWSYLVQREDGSTALSGFVDGMVCKGATGEVLPCFPSVFEYDGREPIILHLGDSGNENPAEGAGGSWRHASMRLYPVRRAE